MIVERAVDYAVSLSSGNEEWASTIDLEMREHGKVRNDFGPHQCPSCEKEATMVAVGSNPESKNGEYSTSPHFRVSHDPECEISGVENLVAKGVVKAAKTQFPAAASFPARLIRPETRDKQSHEPNRQRPPVKDRTESTTTAGSAKRSGPRASEVSTLLPIARHYLNYRAVGFGGRTIELPARGSTESPTRYPYGAAFVRLWPGPYMTTVPQKIMYAQMMWAEDPAKDSEGFSIPIFAGPIPEGGNRPTEPHMLRVDWTEWTQAQRESLENRVKQLQTEAKRGDASKVDINVFFFPDAQLVNGVEFRVDSHADFSIVVSERQKAAKHPRRRTR